MSIVNQTLIMGTGSTVLSKLTMGTLEKQIKGDAFIFVQGNSTGYTNALELQRAYNAAKNMNPNGAAKSATNRVTIVVAPGVYTFGGSRFTLNTQFIDIVSMTGNRDVNIDGVIVTADNVYIRGVKCGHGVASTDYLPVNQFKVSTNLNNLKCENCEGGKESFASKAVCSGTYIDCAGGEGSFGGSSAAGVASGTFIRCITTSRGFGGFLGTCSGVLYDCINNEGMGFGACGTCSGTLYRCIEKGNISFGGYYPGATTGTFSGKAYNCKAASDAFGSASLTGKLYYCTLTSGVFRNVSAGGRTYYCIDGSGTPNNQ
jgi:hypothetical protein